MLTETIDYKYVFDSVDEMILLLNEDEIIISANKSAVEKLNLDLNKREDNSGSGILGSAIWNDLISNFRLGNKASNRKYTLSTENGNKINIRIKGEKISNGKTGYYVLVITDITEKKKEHLELLRFSNDLNKAKASLHIDSIISPIIKERGKTAGFLTVHKIITDFQSLEQRLISVQRIGSLGVLAAGIAHEIGNPLASISSIAQLIEHSTDDAFMKEKLGNINRQIFRIADIIRQVTEFSHHAVHTFKPISINHIIINSVNIVKMGTAPSNIVFDLELENELPKLNLVSEDMMQVMMNILLNAVESFNNKTGKIAVKTSLKNEHIEITITDTGRGIPEENLDRIFDPFFSTKSTDTGAGLGLWVSYGIIRNSGGDVLAESSSGKGTKVTVFLPLKK